MSELAWNHPDNDKPITLSEQRALERMHRMKREHLFRRATHTQRRSPLCGLLFPGLELVFSKLAKNSDAPTRLRVVAIDGKYAVVRGLNWVDERTGKRWLGYVAVASLLRFWRPCSYELRHHRETKAWARERAARLGAGQDEA